MMKKVLLVLVAALFIVGCGGSSVSTIATPTPTPAAETQAPTGNAAVGDTLGWPDSHMLTVIQVDFKVAGVLAADPGFHYVAVEVVFESIEEIDYNQVFDFEIRDSSGYSYDVAIFGDKEPALGSGTLRKGSLARGWVVFEVADGATGLELWYEQFLVGNYGVWDLGS
jgi:uncharacterized protein YceK